MTDFKDPDEELVHAALMAPEGDLRAFEQLVQMYRKRIMADCQYLTHDINNSEDLAQEVFVKAFFGMRTFEGRSSFRHWLQRIKVHHCLNHLKKQDGNGVFSLDDDSEQSFAELQVSPVADKALEAMDERRRVQKILASLPDTLRIPLIMRDMDELPYEDIAMSLGIGLSAVKMRVKRAREQFRALYRGSEEPTGGQTANEPRS